MLSEDDECILETQNIHPVIKVNTAHVSAVGTSLSVIMAPFTSRLEEVTAKQPWQGWVCLLTFVSWGKHKASLSCSITGTVSYLCCGVTVGVNVETIYSIFSTKQLFNTHFSPSRKSGNWSQGLWLWSHTVAFIGVAVSLWRRNHSLETLAY